jgi:hypothetical protein
VSVLFRQPHGFEGFRLAHVELLVDDQPVPERIGPRHLPKGISYLRLLVTQAQHRPQSVNAYSARASCSDRPKSASARSRSQ